MKGEKPVDVLLVRFLPPCFPFVNLTISFSLFFGFVPPALPALAEATEPAGCTWPHPPLLREAMARLLSQLPPPDDAGPGGDRGSEVREFLVIRPMPNQSQTITLT